MNDRKWIALIAAGIVMLAALAGCGTPAAPSAPITASGGAYPAVPPGSALLLTWRPDWGELHVVDLKTGDPVQGYEPIKAGMAVTTALSPDGKTLAAYMTPNNAVPAGGSLHLIDLAKWEDHDTKIDINEYPGLMAFSPDGKYLVISSGNAKSHLALVDVESQKLIADVLTSVPVKLMQFTSDSQRIVTYGASLGPVNKSMEEAVPHAAVYAVPDLAVEWETELTGIVDGMIDHQGEQPPYYTWLPGAAFRADGEMLYVVHADEDKLTSVDLNKHTVTSVKVGPQTSLLDQIMALGAGTARAKALDGTTKQVILSPDGMRLYVATEIVKSWQTAEDFKFEQTHPDSVKVIDTATGAEIGLVVSEAGQLAASADGTRLFGYGFDYNTSAQFTDVIETADLKKLGRIDGWLAKPAHLPDGRWVLLGVKDGRLAVIDSATLEVISEWREEGWSEWIVGQ